MNRASVVFAIAAWAAAAIPAVAQRVEEVQVAPPVQRLEVDARLRAVATAYDGNGNPLDIPLRWSSSNISVAEVDSATGMVRAVTPGVAIITAAAGDGRGRRSGRLTLFVSPARTGSAPPAALRRFVEITVDSALVCESAVSGVRNPGRQCFDVPPIRRLGTPSVPVPAQCTTPAGPAVVAVRVAEDGSIVETTLIAPSQCPQFDEAAMAAARSQTFRPARRDGRPVAAWGVVAIRPSGEAPMRPPGFPVRPMPPPTKRAPRP